MIPDSQKNIRGIGLIRQYLLAGEPVQCMKRFGKRVGHALPPVGIVAVGNPGKKARSPAGTTVMDPGGERCTCFDGLSRSDPDQVVPV